MDPPRVKRVMTLNLQQGCYLIASVGVGCAITAIVLVIFYSLIHSIMDSLLNYKPHDSVKKAITVVLIFNALMLIAANAFLMVGTTFNHASAYELSAYMLFIMISMDMIIVAGGPVSCFFNENGCTVIKNSSHIIQVMLIVGMMIHLDIWSYFMICIFSAGEQRSWSKK